MVQKEEQMVFVYDMLVAAFVPIYLKYGLGV
ncbi:uncharacterized protein FIBRA_09417 [Fibroporia radiculosa]|uniref:Uncharacterized protein n=1 Tax=Fibroporia radiculosa TaxID=599839 RepID=J7RVZ4_9APHY|nr:uncharacterized protein FIBRA_09417 [Fibroporia radiculosa]CCM07090.1 predicted protein [Fibroporia radiculosa]